MKITWLGHASFKVEKDEGFRVYIDPWKIKEKERASLVLITHPHYDHLSVEDVEKIKDKDTVILVTEDARGKFKGDVRGVRPGQEIKIGDVAVRTTAAYNLGRPYHPKENKWVGYILEMEGISLYHCGDTDFIPEMEKFKPYVLLVPIGGVYTMGVEDAVKAVEKMKPEITIPMHYADIVGSVDDARRFARLCEGKTQVKILQKGEVFNIK